MEGLKQGICAPLIYRGIPLGVIHVLSLSRYQFLPTEVQFFSLIALYLASLIVNSQLLTDSRRREEELSCLNKLSQTMQELWDLDSVSGVLLSETIRITEADAGIVLLYDDTGEARVAAAQGLPANLDVHFQENLKSIVTRAPDFRDAFFVSSARHSGAREADIPSPFGNEGSSLLLPLCWQEEKLGALLLYSRSPREAEQWRARFLTLVCAQAALTIQRAALYRRLVEVSRNERLLRSYYEKMVASAPVAMEIIDKDCKIIGWNEAAEELTGIPREKAIGADKFRLQPGLLKHQGREILANVFSKKEVLKLRKFPYERRDGTTRYTDLTFLPFIGEEGEVTAIIVFAQDVTELEALRSSTRVSVSTRLPSQLQGLAQRFIVLG